MPSFLSPVLNDPAEGWTLGNRRNQRVVAASIETAFDSESRRRGLLGRDGLAEGTALIIAPCPSIHTFFMRFPIDVIFASREGRIVKLCHGVRAWRIAIGWGAFAAIEMAVGAIARADCLKGDYLELMRQSGQG